MRKILLILFIPGVIACLIVASNVVAADPGATSADGARTRYMVCVTNLTRGQPFSPVVIFTHHESMDPLFVLGEPASRELTFVAEDAVSTPLTDKLNADPAVLDVEILTGAGGPIIPGETASLVIDAGPNFDRISMVSMLVVTNDAFTGLNGCPLPLMESVHLESAYDAGTETNNEQGRYIPGPPFGNGNVRQPFGAEGYVHVHSGVVGKASLSPELHDWRNPVMKVTIEKM